MTTFDKAAASELVKEGVVPRYVLDLGFTIEDIGSDSVLLRLPFADALSRDNGALCGQALLGLADSAMALAICAAHGSYLPMATVDQTMHFIKPAIRCNVLAEAKVIRLGRTMAFGTVSIRPEQDDNLVALAQLAYSVVRNESVPTTGG
jgi:uncharacterized protein (TIGR00369 family)